MAQRSFSFSKIPPEAWIYLGLAGCFGLLVAVKGGDLLQNMQRQSAADISAQQAVRDNATAEQRFSMGCNTGFLVNGQPTLVKGQLPVDALAGTAIAPGAVLCDRTGATAIVQPNGLIGDIAVSARVRKAFLDNKLGVK